MNKKIPFPVAIIIIVLFAFLAGAIDVYQLRLLFKEISAPPVIFSSPAEKSVEVEFPIDGEEEAIAYAKTDPDTKEFIKGWSVEEFNEHTFAVWDPNRRIWEVGINPITEKDMHVEYLFLIHFESDGTIIDKGVVPAA